MALAQTGVLSRVESLAHLPGQQKFGIVLAIAAIIALLAGAWMWEQSPDYKVLFSNLSDRDGGSIINSLQQMNVPYKFADGGGAILVPAGQVHEARLKLAAQGLPKGGLVGFELMENQKFGASQFQEQVNFQRALEGELARSIQSLSAVQGARVHLAMAKQSVFVRESQKPSASVLVNLHPGRSLDAQQVSAVVHLVASSVPELPVKNVTVVDQNGNLLTKNTDSESNTGLDPSQLKYVQDLEQSYVRRIEAILTPIVGPGNVRAQVTADVDFSNSEQTNETYKPNQTPANAAIRSQQASESTNGNGQGAGGIPGALTNQPPAPAQAPIVAPPGAGPAATPGSVASSTSRKDMTTHYEVDKTIKHVRMPVGGLNRLSVAVVVNNITQTDPKGAITTKPLSDAEKAQATDLVKEAMGFNKERGDTLNVVNSPFAAVEKEAVAEVPIWKQPETVELAKQSVKQLVIAALVLYLALGVLRPMLKRLAPPQATAGGELLLPVEEGAAGSLPGQQAQLGGIDQGLALARQMAKDNPKAVAGVVKSWVSGN